MNDIKNFSTILYVLVICSLCSCTYAQKNIKVEEGDMPGWVNNPLKFYPEDTYIVGVGSGDTRSDAEKDAVGNISRVFQSKITVDETLIENYLETEGKSGSDLSFSSQMLKQSSIGSSQDLKNIKIDRAYFSSSEGLYYVAAYLDRAETASLYRKDIMNNDDKIQEYFENYKTADNKLNQFAYLSKSKALTEVNSVLGQQYQILTSGGEVPASIPKSELDKEMRQLLDKITVALIPAEKTDPQVTDFLQETVGKIGFKIIKGNSDFTFNYELNITKTNLNRPNVVGFNWKMTVRVEDKINQQTLKAFNIQKRTAGISEQEAQGKIMRLVRKELTQNFYKQFLSYINSL